MEIYSYVGAAAARRNTSQEKKNFSYEKIRSKKSSEVLTLSSFQIDSSRGFSKAKARPKSITFDEISVFADDEKSSASSEFASKVKFYFPLFLLIAIVVFVPVTVFRVLSYFESHTLPLSFQDDSSDFELLDDAMSRFAMESVVSDVDENGNVLDDNGNVLTAASVGVGEKVTFQNYTVKSGDSISTITRKFGLSNISTLIAVNDISNVRTLRSGQKLKIPSQDGLVHTVLSGDSLNAISVKYHTSVEEILDANDLSSETLSKGMQLFIPGAKLDQSTLKKAMGELFVCPIKASYRISSYFGKRADPFTGVASNHTGVDLACPQGTGIYAAMSGKVVYVGWSNVFGNYVIINHGNGYQSLYGHMIKALAKNGAYVDQGTKIGLVGSTGYSTGPHLHFTVYKNGKLVDPLTLIKR